MSADLLYFAAIITTLALSAWVHMDFSERERQMLALARDEEQS